MGNCWEGRDVHRQSHVVRETVFIYPFDIVSQLSAFLQAKSPGNPYRCQTHLLRFVRGVYLREILLVDLTVL